MNVPLVSSSSPPSSLGKRGSPAPPPPTKGDLILSDYSDTDDDDEFSHSPQTKKIKLADDRRATDVNAFKFIKLIKNKIQIYWVLQLVPAPCGPYQHWLYTDYAEEILTTLHERELDRRSYADQSPQIEHRDQMIGVIRFVAKKKGLSRLTVHLGKELEAAPKKKKTKRIIKLNLCLKAVYLLDVFMDNHRITVERLVLVTMCTLVLASKMEDRENQTPKLNDIGSLLNSQFYLNQWNELERLILTFFDFRLVIPTATTFFEYFIEVIVIESDVRPGAVSLSSSRYCSFLALKRELISLALDYLDLTLANRYMVQETPSKISAACMAAARSSFMELTEIWPMRLADLTGWPMVEIDIWMHQLQAARCESTANLLATNVLFQTPTFRTVGIFETPESGYVSSRGGGDLAGHSGGGGGVGCNLKVSINGVDVCGFGDGGGAASSERYTDYDDEFEENLEMDSSYTEEEEEEDEADVGPSKS